MAGAGLLMLLDDIAAVLDDVALMSKVAARKSAAMADDVAGMTKVAMQKTAGVLGDDLALNAEQVTGVRTHRELPVVWGVAKGSLLNKVILVPAFLLISAFMPWLITPLLMVGGAFLCFEGVEKSFLAILERNGVQRHDAAGKPFDPAMHQAMAEQPAPEGVAPGTVLTAWTPAWTLNGRLLKPAMVVVASGAGG